MTTQQLNEVYKRAQLDILRIIDRKTTRGKIKDYEKDLLLQINGILEKLGYDTKEWIDDVIAPTYEQAAKRAYESLTAGKQSIAFGGINQAAVRVISLNTLNTMQTALWTAGRRIDDMIRHTSIDVVQRGFAAGQGIRELKKTIINDLAEQGMALGIPDKRGRMMPLDAYAEMVARTTTREVTNKATYDMGEALDEHLYKMTTHFPTCKICAPRQGRVYRSIEFPKGDERNQFPLLSEAIPNWPEYWTVHPNCRHVFTAISWTAYSRKTKNVLLDTSGQSLDVDPRSEREIKAYNAGQAKNRILREDRKQWRRYQAALGNDNVPKTLAGFKRSKYSKSERWMDMQNDYRKVVRMMNQ